MGVPIFRDGKVEGAVCAEYTVSSLGNLINGSEMSQYGAKSGSSERALKPENRGI